ncbi:MAG: hypothetical protein WC495_05600 [Patescibacteria group bacterium]
MKKRSDIFRDMMSYHFSKDRNDDIPMMQQQFTALREAICHYLDGVLPDEAHDQIEELERRIDNEIDRLERKLKDYIPATKTAMNDWFLDGKLKCCPNCHTVVENFSSIRVTKKPTDGEYYQKGSFPVRTNDGENIDFYITYRCNHCLNKDGSKMEPTKEEPKPESECEHICGNCRRMNDPNDFPNYHDHPEIKDGFGYCTFHHMYYFLKDNGKKCEFFKPGGMRKKPKEE